MEGGEQGVPSATAAASTAGDPTASPPPLDDPVSGSDPATVSDDVPESEIHALISDDEHGDDHDHDHDHDHEHDHLDEDQDRDHAAVTGVSLDDLKIKIIKQVEYYFSDENLPTDKYLSGFVKRNKEGFGHGSTSSTHAAEASKPPPGPKMPDGTRGFAIGRGRPAVPASN